MYDYRQLPEQIFSTILICPDNTTNQKQLIRNESVSLQDLRSNILSPSNLHNVKSTDSTFILLDTHDYAFLRQGLIIKFFIAYNHALPIIKVFKYNLQNIYLPPVEVDSIIIDQILDHYEYDHFLSSLKDHNVDPLDELVMSVPKILESWEVSAQIFAKYLKLDKYKLTAEQLNVLAPNFPLYNDQDALGNLQFMLVSRNLSTIDYATNVDQGLVESVNETFIKELQPQDLLSIRNPAGCYLFEHVYPEDNDFYKESKKRFIHNFYPLRQILSRADYQKPYETSPLAQESYLQKPHVVRHSLDISRIEYLELLYIASPDDLDKYSFGEYEGSILFNLAYKGLEKIYNTFSNDYFNYIRFNLSNNHKYASFKSPDSIKLTANSNPQDNFNSTNVAEEKQPTKEAQQKSKVEITKQAKLEATTSEPTNSDDNYLEYTDNSSDEETKQLELALEPKLSSNHNVKSKKDDIAKISKADQDSQDQVEDSNNTELKNSDTTSTINVTTINENDQDISETSIHSKSIHPLDQINQSNYKFSVNINNQPSPKLTKVSSDFKPISPDNLLKSNREYNKFIYSSNIKSRLAKNNSKESDSIDLAKAEPVEEKLPPISRIKPNNPKLIIPSEVRWHNKTGDFIEGIDYIKWDSPIHRPPVFIYNTIKVVPYNYSLTLSFVNFTSICSFPFRFSLEQDHIILLNYLNLFTPKQYYPYGLIDKIDSQQNQFVNQDLKEIILDSIDLLYAQFLVLFYEPQAYNSKHLSDFLSLMTVTVRICDQLFSNNPSLEQHVKYMPMREFLFLQLEAIGTLANGQADNKEITEKLRHLFNLQNFTMFIVFLRLLYVSSFEHNDKHADHKEFLKHFDYKE